MMSSTDLPPIHQTNHLRLLLALGRDLLATDDLDHLLQTALQRAMDFSDHDGGSILLSSSLPNTLEVRAAAGHDAAPVGTRVENLAQSISGRVMATQQPLIIYGHGDAIGTEWRTFTRAIPSVVCLPLLIAEHKPIGVLSLKSTVAVRQLDREDIDTLQMLAALLAAAVTNNRLHQERNQLLHDLATREQQLQHLIGQQLAAHEEERRRVAYDLHDGLAQTAVSAYQHLQAFASRYRSRSVRNRQILQHALDLALRTVQEARQVIGGLRPTALDDLGLVVALRLMVEDYAAQQWDMSFVESLAVGRLPTPIETALFRVAQEALNNVRKHAYTTRVQVTLQRDDHGVRLEVRDWGRGFVPQQQALHGGRGEHIGMLGMHERIILLGGTFTVSSTVGEGTTVVVTVPLTPNLHHENNV